MSCWSAQTGVCELTGLVTYQTLELCPIYILLTGHLLHGVAAADHVSSVAGLLADTKSDVRKASAAALDKMGVAVADRACGVATRLMDSQFGHGKSCKCMLDCT